MLRFSAQRLHLAQTDTSLTSWNQLYVSLVFYNTGHNAVALASLAHALIHLEQFH